MFPRYAYLPSAKAFSLFSSSLRVLSYLLPPKPGPPNPPPPYGGPPPLPPPLGPPPPDLAAYALALAAIVAFFFLAEN